MPEHDRVVKEFYPPLRRRRDFSGLTKEQLAIQDTYSFQKKRDWAIRQRMVPGEVLEASNAFPEEKSFLLGEVDRDPAPLRIIRYYDLVVGEEMELPDDLDLKKPVLPSTRFISRERGTLRQEVVNALLFKPLTPMSKEQMGTMERQIKFEQQVDNAIRLAWGKGSDMNWTEWEVIKGIRNPDGSAIEDYRPEHLPTYKRLVRTPEVVILEN